jgi:glycosyltransferase involved in cell wall biosynthesis
MKILFVADAIDPSLGGGNAERTYQLARALHDRGAGIALLTTRLGLGAARAAALAPFDCTLVRSLGRRFVLPLVWPGTVARCVRQADVVHIGGHWSWLGALSGWFALRQGRPYVYTPAGSLPLFGRSRTIKRLYNVLIGHRLVRNAACCLAITELERAHFHPYGVPDARIHLLPNGVDPVLPAGISPERARARHGAGTAPLLLFLGRLSPIKGPDLLIEAFAQLRARHPDARLILAGPDAGLQDTLERRVRALNLGEAVRFAGPVSGHDKLDLLAAADCLVVPSRQEAMSLVVLEAGQLGTPALITDQCGFDALAAADGGCIVGVSVAELARGLVQMLDRRATLPAQGANLRRLVHDRYTWPRLAARAQALFEQLIPAAHGQTTGRRLAHENDRNAVG